MKIPRGSIEPRLVEFLRARVVRSRLFELLECADGTKYASNSTLRAASILLIKCFLIILFQKFLFLHMGQVHVCSVPFMAYFAYFIRLFGSRIFIRSSPFYKCDMKTFKRMQRY